MVSNLLWKPSEYSVFVLAPAGGRLIPPISVSPDILLLILIQVEDLALTASWQLKSTNEKKAVMQTLAVTREFNSSLGNKPISQVMSKIILLKCINPYLHS